jgi:hypothetical protein
MSLCNFVSRWQTELRRKRKSAKITPATTHCKDTWDYDGSDEDDLSALRGKDRGVNTVEVRAE